MMLKIHNSSQTPITTKIRPHPILNVWLSFFTPNSKWE